MVRRKSAKRVQNDQEECARILASLLALSAEDEARRDLASALRRLRNVIQSRSISASEDDWLLQVEQSAAQVREQCRQFQDDNASLREEVYSLLRSFEEACRVLVYSKSIPFDPIRVLFTCRSFKASYRLQAQRDEQIVEEILSFLSALYANIDFTATSREQNDVASEQAIGSASINGWIEQLDNQIILSSSPWQDTLRELHKLCCSKATLQKQNHEMLDLDYSNVTERGKARFREDSSVPFMDPVVDSESIMGAVERFLGTPDTGQSPSSFLLLIGAQGSGKTFICDEIEQRAQIDGSSVQGMFVIRTSY